MSQPSQLYTFAQAAAAAQLPEKQLRNWLDRDIVMLGEDTRAGRGWRRFTDLDVIQLAFIQQVAGLGISLPRAVAWSEMVREQLETFGPAVRQFNFRSYPDGVEIIRPDDGLMPEPPRPAPLLHLQIDLAALIDRVGAALNIPRPSDAPKEIP